MPAVRRFVQHAWNREYRSIKLEDILEDWVVLEAEQSPTLQQSTWKPASTPTIHGEIIYAAKYDYSLRTVRYVPLNVVHGEFFNSTNDIISDRIVVTKNATEADLHSFSGGFVGRFDQETQTWEYIGMPVIAVTINDEPGYQLVLRPPQEALDWLLAHPVPSLETDMYSLPQPSACSP